MINPYGWKMWWEVWMQLTDAQLRWSIQEWTPGILMLNVGIWFYSVILFSLLINNWKKTSLFEKILSLSFFSISLSSVRNIPLFLLVSLPFCIRMWFDFEISITQEMKKNFLLIKNTLVILCIFVGLICIGNIILKIKPINKDYPVNGVSFLLQHKAKGRIFSEYDWGGYLIWKAPMLKVFIDGRMPSWRWRQNNLRQSNNIADEYFIITSKYPSFESYRKKYNINYVLIRKDKKKNIFVKYQKTYEDEISIVYKL